MRKRKGYGANPFAPGNPYVPDNRYIPERERESYASLRAPRDKDDRPGGARNGSSGGASS
jgi:hypothetical protein